MDIREFLRAAAHVKPSKRQLAMLRETPFYCFVHFGVNTFTGREWGDGSEDSALFDPIKLDCEQWARAAVSAGMTGLVLTAKHHDGFCLWQTDTTDHSVKSSPWRGGRGDVVAEAAAACKKHGLKFGFYLSPWDRNCPLYGSDAYNDFYKRQLTELLTRYGEIFYVWFDGACGEGPNGRKQIYDFKGYADLVHELQPNAAIFHDTGEVRWCGNEAGKPPRSQWAVVPRELCGMNPAQTQGPALEGSLDGVYNTDEGIGELPGILYSSGLVFAPAEFDMSLHDGWFYHPDEAPHSLERLWTTWLGSVGSNATFNLNVPPTPEGLFCDADVTRLAEFGALLRERFGTPVPVCVDESYPHGDTQPRYRLTLASPVKAAYLDFAEAIAEGQRVENYKISAVIGDRTHKLAQGTTVGSRKVVPFKADEAVIELIVDITAARDVPRFEWFRLYAAGEG